MNVALTLTLPLPTTGCGVPVASSASACHQGTVKAGTAAAYTEKNYWSRYYRDSGTVIGTIGYCRFTVTLAIVDQHARLLASLTRRAGLCVSWKCLAVSTSGTILTYVFCFLWLPVIAVVERISLCTDLSHWQPIHLISQDDRRCQLV